MKAFFASKAIYVVFVLCLFLRVYQLVLIPHGFHVDEVISGYIGRFVLLHGKDVYGNFFPFFYFDAFGDYRTILPMYINGISTFLFGVNIFAVRFPTALIGSFAIFPIFFISKMIFKNDKMALVPPLVYSLLPWNIVLSRATDEAVVGLTFSCFALYFLLQSIFRKKLSLLFIGCLFLFCTYFMYPTFRLLSPFILLPLPLIAQVQKRWYIASVVIFFAISALFFLTPYGQGRFQQTSLLGNHELASRIRSQNIAYQYDEGNNGSSAFVARMFHNNATGYVRELATQYASYFSPNFLFLSGGLPDRYVVPLQGLLYISFGLLLFALLLPIGMQMNNKIFSYFLYILLISPLPAVLTLEDVPNINRSIMMSLAFVFLIGIGFAKAYSVSRSTIYRIAFCTIIILTTLLEFINFQHNYFTISPSYKSFLRDDGNVELITYLQAQDAKRNVILPTHDMPMYYLFFNNNFDASLAGKFTKGPYIPQVHTVYFVANLCPTNVLTHDQREDGKLLIVEDGNCVTSGDYTVVKTITRRDSTVAFRIVSPR